ncbi:MULTISPECIES: MarR family winged helix-turn-helix transcriptional regulator [Streptomyces]|uniref:MarR family transcriptional regulator n=1 Tax=Streptomyces silvisoli TaxID=3034235 RepID=A0ABT5ZEP4_9ACTN|nr:MULTISPECIES: MarR family transcriptional regulator [Streptomyces]MDF3288272.1 MarR family transcriptional regulator [Streptomyces silvisoli]
MDDRTQTATRVWHDLRVLLLEQHDRRKEVAEALGMSFNRVKALRRIAAQPHTLRSLAEYMVIDAPYATLIVDDLAKRGLVERTANPADRRSKLVHITPRGKAAADEADRILDTPPEALLALPPGDLAALDRIVDQLLA